ncbi:type IV pilus modification PilV family protein [Oryzibacter oryziterrae]|uniref:type IV pilus modification PilV family protein n=1 Tax=Oryzibacter oryziterrae TaxID=2766474 RepID=UPI001F395A21|nr:type II secretion system protein [Oryzibacter oryziterrae]
MRARRDGFTLVEVLASLVILSVLALAVTRGVVAARQSGDAGSATLDAARVARELIEGPVTATFTGPTSKSGTLYGHAYKIVAAPLDLNLPGTTKTDDSNATWTPLRFTVSVETTAGHTLSVETVRLVKGGPQ